MKRTLFLLALCPMAIALADTTEQKPSILLNKTLDVGDNYHLKYHEVSGSGTFYLSGDMQSDTSALDLSATNIWLSSEDDSPLVLEDVSINNTATTTDGKTTTHYGILVEKGEVVIDNIQTGDLKSNLSIGTAYGDHTATLTISGGSQVETTAYYNTIGANGSAGTLNIKGENTILSTNQITFGSTQCLNANESTIISGDEKNYNAYSSKSASGEYEVGYGIMRVSDGATMNVGKGNADRSTNKLQIYHGEVHVSSTSSLVMHDNTTLTMDSIFGLISNAPDSESSLIIESGGSLKMAEGAKLRNFSIGGSFHDNNANAKIHVSGEGSLLDLDSKGVCYVGGAAAGGLTSQGNATISLLADDGGSAAISSDDHVTIAYNYSESTTKQDVNISAETGGKIGLESKGGIFIGSSTTHGDVSMNATGESSSLTASAEGTLHLNYGSVDDFSVAINSTDGATVSLIGKNGIKMNKNTTVTVDGEGSSLSTEGDVTATSSQITIGSGATWDAHDKIILKEGTSLNNSGTLTATQLALGEGSIFNNNGKLYGTLTAGTGAKITGSGSFGTLVVQSGSTLVVGNSPGLQTVESLEIQSGSETIFSVAGLQLGDVATATDKGWDSGKYSSIVISENGALTLANGANFTIAFGGGVFDESLLVNGGMSYTQQFELLLIQNGVTLTEDSLTTLMDNTIFTVSTEEGANPNNWSISVSGAQYRVENSNLYLSGSITAIIPEPTTATLSLLALVGFAARRRRASC